MLFVRYALSFLRWNDLFSNRTPIYSVTRPLTCAYYRSNAFCLRFLSIPSVILDIYKKVIPMFNSKTRFVLKTKLSFSYSWDVLNFLSALKC